MRTLRTATLVACSLAFVGQAHAQQPTEPTAPPLVPPAAPPPATAPIAPLAEPPTVPPPPPQTAPPVETKPAEEPKPEGGFFPKDGFTLRSSDEAWRARIRLQSFIRASVRVNGKAQLANPFMTLRPILEGQLYKKWIRYWTSLELAANPVYLLDSYVEIQPVDAIGVRIGQQWTPFSRHEAIYGPGQLLFPEWNPAADYFWTGRDKGITLFGAFAEGKLDYSLGAYVGSPLRQFQPIRGNYQFIARVGLSPQGPVGSEFAYAEGDAPTPTRWAFGLNAVTSKIDPGVENFNPSTFKFDASPTNVTTLNNAAGFDIFLQSQRVMGLVEGYIRRTDPHTTGQADFTSIGGFAQLGLMVYKRDLDLAVRGTYLDPNVDADRDQAFAIEGNTSWYIHAPWVVVKARYGYGYQRTPNEGVSAQDSAGAKLISAPGPIHVLTAQINTVF